MNVIIGPFYLDNSVLQREQERGRLLVSDEEESGPWSERRREDPGARSTLSVKKIHVAEKSVKVSEEGLCRRIE